MSLNIILFDFDGTIADTFTETVEMFNHFAQKYGYNRIGENDVEVARHMNAFQLLKFVRIPKRKVPFLLRKGRKMLYKNLDKIKVFDGIREVLEWAEQNDIPCGVVTSNSKKNVERFVLINHLANIHFVRSSSRLMGKHREFRKVLKKRSIEKENAIYIGDESRDIEAAHAAGMKVVSVLWGYNSKQALSDHHPDFMAENGSGLLNILKAVHQEN